MTQKNEHLLVNPTTQAIVAPFDGAPRLPSLAGTRLGIIDDSKRNADVLLEELVDLLRTRYEISVAGRGPLADTVQCQDRGVLER